MRLRVSIITIKCATLPWSPQTPSLDPRHAFQDAMQELSLHGGFVKVDHFGLECSTVHEPGDENKVETTPRQFSRRFGDSFAVFSIFKLTLPESKHRRGRRCGNTSSQVAGEECSALGMLNSAYRLVGCSHCCVVTLLSCSITSPRCYTVLGRGMSYCSSH